MQVKALGKGRVGRRDGQYVLYLDRYASELLKPYAGRRARVHISDGQSTISVDGTLSIEKSFRPPRIAVFLPRALNPTWQRLYDREFAVVIEVQEGDDGIEARAVGETA
ncbi:hypothetical protein [Vulcanisaeta sp. JCM 14467]|uniref:hypothetical protein n=1 Tax=Vulcanisaeta sp. JCM 14467 TaxID=1295370 RepID=UPI0006D1E255|nr:hypothetical protein [Vulcanisaeta sp. JCM 14467]